jgi:hypothetical protein
MATCAPDPASSTAKAVACDDNGLAVFVLGLATGATMARSSWLPTQEDQGFSGAKQRRGTKVPSPSCGFAGAAPGEDVMAKLINELLLLTCMGAFIASATYAVTLLH